MAKSLNGMPESGQNAPQFTLPNQRGEMVTLADLKGKWTVLYFYPKDDTPGCTTEAKEFRDESDSFEELNAVIVGISPDDVATHCRFTDKFALPFHLLADPDHAAIATYGVWVEKNMYGKKSMGVQRATFLIDPEGKIAEVWPRVKPGGHSQQVLQAIHKRAAP